MKTIHAIILSGGDSSRMGSHKALLNFGGESFLEHCIEALSHESIANVFVMTGTAHDEIDKHVQERSLPVTLIRNPHPDEGQYSSLQMGIRSVPKVVDAVIVHLVDHPLVKKETVAAILKRFEETNASITIPSYQHRRGHPVLYSSSLFQEIISTFPEHGARSILDLHKAEIEYVNVDDPGIRIDIDTRDEYEQALHAAIPKAKHDFITINQKKPN